MTCTDGGSLFAMKSRLILITVFALCIITVGFTAYDKKKDDKRTSKISTNINKLSQLIILPYQPKAVWWQITRIGTPYTPHPPGPNDWSVDAVLLFDEKDIELILHESQFEQQLELPESIIDDLPELRDLLKKHGTS